MAEIYGFKVNGTTYQYDYNYLANKPMELPEYGDGDEGKVLTVNDTGELEWQSIAGEENASDGMLPPMENANSGDVLMITSDLGGNQPEWRQLLPSYGSGSNGCALTITEGGLGWSRVIPRWSEHDIGSVLTIDEDGELQWTPAGAVIPTNPT